MAVGPFIRKTDLVDLVRAQDINELQIACEDLQSQLNTFLSVQSTAVRRQDRLDWRPPSVDCICAV